MLCMRLKIKIGEVTVSELCGLFGLFGLFGSLVCLVPFNSFSLFGVTCVAFIDVLLFMQYVFVYSRFIGSILFWQWSLF